MSATAFRPTLSWPEFLRAAPDFASLAADLDEEQAPTAAPLLRAAFYFTIFSGQVANGGVMQYFFNKALYLPGFDQAPDFVAQHPALSRAAAFMAEAHAAWDDVAPAVKAARGEEDGSMDIVSDLFSSHEERFEALEARFYAVNRDLDEQLNAAIVRDPHAYFDITPLPEVPSTGVAHVELAGGAQRLRFVDGFPVGPNLFEQEDGQCGVIWFNRDRSLLEMDLPGHQRFWIHYPSLATATLQMGERGLEGFKTQRSRWYEHGVSQDLRPDGSCSNLTFSQNGSALRATDYHPDGSVHRFEETREDGVHGSIYWPNGQLNMRYVQDAEYVNRYTCCFDENGVDQAPGGQGLFREFLGVDDDDGRLCWREGRLVNGFPEGRVVWYASEPDGANPEATTEADYKDGREQWE